MVKVYTSPGLYLSSNAENALTYMRNGGYMTSGDISDLCGLSRPYVKKVFGEPQKQIKKNGRIIGLWHKDKIAVILKSRDEIKLPRRY